MASPLDELLLKLQEQDREMNSVASPVPLKNNPVTASETIPEGYKEIFISQYKNEHLQVREV